MASRSPIRWATSVTVPPEARAVAECHAVEFGMAAIQSHQAALEAQLPQELGVLLSLPIVSCRSDGDRLRSLHHRKR